MRTTIVIMTAALMLTACGSKDGPGNSGGGSEGGAAAGAQQTDADTPEVSSGNEMIPLPPQPSPTATVNGMPASFQGRWGMVPNDCVPGRSDAKGLMIVSADGLGFYESRGAIEKVVNSTPGTLTFDLQFTGEGQQWLRRETLTLLDDGKTLVREEQKPAGSFRYSKCPAGKEEPTT